MIARLARLDGQRSGAAITMARLAFVGVMADHFVPNGSGWLYFSLVYHLGEFVIGASLALMIRSGNITRRLPVWVAATVACAPYLALLPLDRASGYRIVGHDWIAELMVLPASALLIITAAQRDLAGGRGWLHHPALVRLGQWSFALYLIHRLALQASTPLSTGPWAWGPWRSSSSSSSVAQALAAAAYRWYERPVESYIRSPGHQRESVSGAPIVERAASPETGVGEGRVPSDV